MLAKLYDFGHDFLFMPFFKLWIKFKYGPWDSLVQKTLNMPRALPMKAFSKADDYCWEDWRKDTKASRPVRFFLFYTLPYFISSNFIVRAFERFVFWFESNIYKCHLLDLRDSNNVYKRGWIEHDTALVYSVFKCVERFIKEAFPELINKSEEEFVINANEALDFYFNTGIDFDVHWAVKYGEIFDAYYFWVYERPKMHKVVCDAGDNSLSIEEDLDNLDTTYMNRVIAIRKCMWC